MISKMHASIQKSAVQEEKHFSNQLGNSTTFANELHPRARKAAECILHGEVTTVSGEFFENPPIIDDEYH